MKNAFEYEAEITALREELAENRQVLDATRIARDAEQYTNKDLRENLAEMNTLLVDLVNSPHAVVVPLELWKRIHTFLGTNPIQFEVRNDSV